MEQKCFNGAAPVKGRKGITCRPARSPPPSFNGAAPVKGRKESDGNDPFTKPKGFNGAAPVKGRKVPIRPSAWTAIGCFNGAAPVKGRKGFWACHHIDDDCELQWGRPCEGAERAHQQQRQLADTGASMGPPL